MKKMMRAVKFSLEDADVAILLVDIKDEWQRADDVFGALKLKIPSILVLNKTDRSNDQDVQRAKSFFEEKGKYSAVMPISAMQRKNVDGLVNEIVKLLPEGEPFFDTGELTDMSNPLFCGRAGEGKNL
jgi:GTP-binding protein Era